MTKDKIINKVVLNLAAISDTLLASIVLTNNYHLNPQTMILTASALMTNSYFISKAKPFSYKKNSSKINKINKISSFFNHIMI